LALSLSLFRSAKEPCPLGFATLFIANKCSFVVYFMRRQITVGDESALCKIP